MSNSTNSEIRLAAKKAGVYFWEIAERLRIQDSAFSRKLRRELPPQEKDHILTIIDTLAKEKAEVS